MEVIILGNPFLEDSGTITPITVPAYEAEETVIPLTDGFNPYIIGSSSSVDTYWVRSGTNLLRPVLTTDKVVIGGASFVGTETLRVVGVLNISGLVFGSESTYVTKLLDEDDLASNDEHALATQQSIKAYVDSVSVGIQPGDNVSLLVNDVPYLITETDPVFLASDAAAVTSTLISNWNTAYGWGNHASAGYLTVEADPVFVASDVYGVTNTDIANWNDAFSKEHVHSNFSLLESIISTGDGTSALFNDGTYKTVPTLIGGSDSYVQYNDSGVLGGDSTFFFNDITKLLTVQEVYVSDQLDLASDASIYIDVDGSNNLQFTDSISGSVTLATLLSAATNYWTTTTGGIYYSTGTDKVGIGTSTLGTEILTVNGNITATDFNSSYFKYTIDSNLLIGPNAGDLETGSNLLYIANSNTTTPLIYGDFIDQELVLNADVYINVIKRLAFGSSTIFIRGDAFGNLIFGDLNANSGNPIFLSDLIIGDPATFAMVADFVDYSAANSVSSANLVTWNKASVIITTGAGDAYLANDGTYKIIGSAGNNVILFLHEEVSDVSGYEKLLTSPANDPENIETVGVTSGTSPILIDSHNHVTEPGYPGLTEIPAGLWIFKTWLRVDSAAGTTTATIRVYKRTDPGGTETELFNVTTAEINNTTVSQFVIESVQPAFSLNATDRIVVKYYASTTSGGTINVFMYYEGSLHYSYIIAPIVSESILVNDYTWKWDSANSYYRPYTTKTEAGGVLSPGKFYNGTIATSSTTRLNYDGNFYSTNLNAQTLTSSIAIGTSPLTVTSNTVVTNLNSDLLDGEHGGYYSDYGNLSSIPTYDYLNSPNDVGGVLIADPLNSGLPGDDFNYFAWDVTNHFLGIGTNAPLSGLDVEGSTATFGYPSGNARFLRTAGTLSSGDLLVSYVGSNIFKITDTTGVHGLSINTTTGSVGIGTFVPSYSLDVQAYSGSSYLLKLQNSDFSSSTTGSGLFIVTGATLGNTYTSIQSFTAGASAVGSLVLNKDGGSIGIGIVPSTRRLEVNAVASQGIAVNINDSVAAFICKNLGSSNKEWSLYPVGNDFRVNEGGVGDVLTFKAGGYIGIGITTPSEILDIESSISGTNLTIRNACLGARGSSQIKLIRGTDGKDNAGVLMYTAPSTFNWYAGLAYNSGGTTSQYIINPTDTTLTNSVFTITNTGNIGIGTSTGLTNSHLTIAAGTGSVVPIKLVNGSFLPSPVDGAIEYSTVLTFTDSTLTRRTFAFTDAVGITNTVTCTNTPHSAIGLLDSWTGALASCTVPTTGNYLISYGCSDLGDSGVYHEAGIQVNGYTSPDANSITRVYFYNVLISGSVSMQYPKSLTAGDVVYFCYRRQPGMGAENIDLYGIYLTLLRVS